MRVPFVICEFISDNFHTTTRRWHITFPPFSTLLTYFIAQNSLTGSTTTAPPAFMETSSDVNLCSENTVFNSARVPCRCSAALVFRYRRAKQTPGIAWAAAFIYGSFCSRIFNVACVAPCGPSWPRSAPPQPAVSHRSLAHTRTTVYPRSAAPQPRTV